MIPPYRTPAELAERDSAPSPTLPRCMNPRAAGDGVLLEGCPAPGWWSRLWNGVSEDAVWRCRCGKTWVLKPYGWTREREDEQQERESR